MRIADIRERLLSKFTAAASQNVPRLIIALPSSGKTTSIVSFATAYNVPITVFTDRHDLYDQLSRELEDAGITSHRLPSHYRDCPTTKKEPDHGNDWKRDVLTKYDLGYSMPYLHRKSTEVFGQPLPCQQGGSCPYMEAHDVDYSEVQVLLGNYRHSWNENYSAGRRVIIDESSFPSLLTRFSAGDVMKNVSRYLDASTLPFRSYQDLMDHRHSPEYQSEIAAWKAGYRRDHRSRQCKTHPSSPVHASSHHLVWGLLTCKRLDNGWNRAELSNGGIFVKSPYTGECVIYTPPRIQDATGVIGLDGTRGGEMFWRIVLGDEMIVDDIFSESEKADYLTECLGLRVIQTTEDTKPYSSGNWVTVNRDLTLIEAIGRHVGELPGIVSSKKAIEAYRRNGVDSLIAGSLYYGNLLGSNSLGHLRTGIVLGSPQQSDELVEELAAFLGHSAERKDHPDGRKTGGKDLDFGPVGNQVLHHLREEQVLQAILRFARDPESADGAARVYVHTSAIPDWVPREVDLVTFHMFDARGMGQCLAGLKNLRTRGQSRFTVKELTAEIVSIEGATAISENQVRNCLNNLHTAGVLLVDKARRPYEWTQSAEHEPGQFGVAVL